MQSILKEKETKYPMLLVRKNTVGCSDWNRVVVLATSALSGTIVFIPTNQHPISAHDKEINIGYHSNSYFFEEKNWETFDGEIWLNN